MSYMELDCASDVAIAQQKPEKPKAVAKPNVLRGALTAILSLVAFVVLMFAPMFSFGDASISLTSNISLFGLIKTLGNSGIHYFTDAEFGELRVRIPTVASLLVLACVIVAFVCFAIGVMGMAGKLGKHEKKLQVVANLFAVLIQASVFVILIAPVQIYGVDIMGEKRPFYQIFSVSAGFLISIFCFVFAFGTSLGINNKNTRLVKKNSLMYVFLLVPAVLIVVYNLYPLLLSLCLSMKKYVISDGIWNSAWVGFDNYVQIFQDSEMLEIIWNTVKISLFRMVMSIVPPIILAVMLFDMAGQKIRKGIQTIIYIPHFFSWVVVYAIAYAFVNPDGLFNSIVDHEVRILANEKVFILLLLITDLWKECGWNTILYMAALTSVDTSLYEAAAIDGAGPLSRLWRITLPSIKPTIVFTSVMSVGNLLKGAGYEQIMLFGSEIMKSANVIDTWVVWKGLQGLQYGLGAAVSFFQSLIGMGMVLGCNYLSKKWVGVGMY